MSYDLAFYRRRAGLTAEELFEAECEREELDEGAAQEPLDPAQMIDQEAVVAALLASNPEFERFYPDESKGLNYIEIKSREEDVEGLQIAVYETQVSITVPYWPMTPAAASTFRNRLENLFAVLHQQDMVGYDPQLGREAVAANFDDLIASHTSTQQAVDKLLKKQKAWWKFW